MINRLLLRFRYLARLRLQTLDVEAVHIKIIWILHNNSERIYSAHRTRQNCPFNKLHTNYQHFDQSYFP